MLKGDKILRERTPVRPLAVLGGGAANIIDYCIPCGDENSDGSSADSVARRLIAVRKVAATAEMYPRRYKLIRSKPL
jgi:hypothetical protein